MAGVIIALLVVIASYYLISIVRWIISRRNCQQVLKRYGIPGPEPNFLDGHMKALRKEPTPHNLIDSWLKKYGNVFGYYMGDVPYIVVNDVDMLKQIMIKDFPVFPNRPDLYMNIHPFKQTMIGLEDQRWKDVRTIISPTFSTSKLKLLKNIFDKKVDIMVGIVSKKVKNNEIFDIYAVFQGLTLDVIADCALAMKTRSQEDPNDILLNAMRDFQHMAHSSAVEYGVMFPVLESIFTFAANYLTIAGKLNRMLLGNLKSVIAERREKPELRSMDILQLMLDSSEQGNSESTRLTDAEVIANAYVSLMAGYETTSTALATTFYALVNYPEIQERLFQEIDKAPDSSYASLQGCHYLNQVFEEALRLYPPVTGFVSRVCKQDHEIGSFTFPKDSVILVPVWHLHHDPHLFPDPWKFDPERFSKENRNSIKNCSYLPFGEGPRNCIGSRFELLEAKLAIFKLLKKFKFMTCEKTEKSLSLVCSTLITTPANGVWVRAVPRSATV